MLSNLLRLPRSTVGTARQAAGRRSLRARKVSSFYLAKFDFLPDTLRMRARARGYSKGFFSLAFFASFDIGNQNMDHFPGLKKKIKQKSRVAARLHRICALSMQVELYHLNQNPSRNGQMETHLPITIFEFGNFGNVAKRRKQNGYRRMNNRKI